MAIPNSRQAQLSSKVNEAVEAGEKFIKVFYESIDKRRQVEKYNSIWNAPRMSTGHVGCFISLRSCQACTLRHLL